MSYLRVTYPFKMKNTLVVFLFAFLTAACNFTEPQSDKVIPGVGPIQLHPENQHYFFVIQKADLLTLACSNRLLKPIEEPPAGYHFIFLSESLDQIIPTSPGSVSRQWG